MKYIVAVVMVFVFLTACSDASAQDRDYPAFGISASFNGGYFISVPIWLKQTVTLSPGLEFRHQDRQYQEVSFEVTLRRNFLGYPAIPYVGVQGQIDTYRRRDYDREIGYTVSLNVGGEYFLSRHLSVSAQAEIASEYMPELRYSEWSANPSQTRVYTYSTILCAFYF